MRHLIRRQKETEVWKLTPLSLYSFFQILFASIIGTPLLHFPRRTFQSSRCINTSNDFADFLPILITNYTQIQALQHQWIVGSLNSGFHEFFAFLQILKNSFQADFIVNIREGFCHRRIAVPALGSYASIDLKAGTSCAFSSCGHAQLELARLLCQTFCFVQQFKILIHEFNTSFLFLL